MPPLTALLAPRCLAPLCLLVSLWLVAPVALSHGGVLLEDDVCVINIGFFKSHFTIYQPQTSGSEEFCEDLPAANESVFVLEYLHLGLRELPVDFRIIRNTTGLGRFARWEDIQALGDLAPLTVFHHGPARHPDGVMEVRHDFAAAGEYIGIVSTHHPRLGKTYRAVFPFQVGWTGPGYWPWLALAGLLFVIYVAASNRGWLRRTNPEPET